MTQVAAVVVAEASELGLAPGRWPHQLPYDGHIFWISHRVPADAAVVYTAVLPGKGTVELHVLND